MLPNIKYKYHPNEKPCNALPAYGNRIQAGIQKKAKFCFARQGDANRQGFFIRVFDKNFKQA